nr:unnamed protein product [Callosobruchus analis]
MLYSTVITVGGQQKNRFVLSAYLYAISHFKYIRSITHKYLITGHSQNEGDSAHFVIERQITGHLKSSAIYTPEQYYTLIRTTKKTGKPYKVTEMCYSDVFDLKHLVSQMEYNNFSKNTDDDAFKLSELKICMVSRITCILYFTKLLILKRNTNKSSCEAIQGINVILAMIRMSSQNKLTSANQELVERRRTHYYPYLKIPVNKLFHGFIWIITKICKS